MSISAFNSILLIMSHSWLWRHIVLLTVGVYSSNHRALYIIGIRMTRTCHKKNISVCSSVYNPNKNAYSTFTINSRITILISHERTWNLLQEHEVIFLKINFSKNVDKIKKYIFACYFYVSGGKMILHISGKGISVLYKKSKCHCWKIIFEHFRLKFQENRIFVYSFFIIHCKMTVVMPDDSAKHSLYTNMICIFFFNF